MVSGTLYTSFLDILNGKADFFAFTVPVTVEQLPYTFKVESVT